MLHFCAVLYMYTDWLITDMFTMIMDCVYIYIGVIFCCDYEIYSQYGTLATLFYRLEGRHIESCCILLRSGTKVIVSSGVLKGY